MVYIPDDNKTQEFLQKLTPCIERGDLDACLEEAARVSREIGMGAGELLELSTEERRNDKYGFSYVIALAAAQELDGGAKAQAYSNAGLASQYAGNLQKAEEHYKKAIEANPKDAEAHTNYANLLDELDRKKEAEDHYLKAIEANPKLAEAHYNYAILLSELDRKKEAEDHYLKAIEANPKLAEAHNDYANFLREKAIFLEAEKEVRIALQIEPKDPYALGTYGDILADEDYLEEAIKKYHEAIKNSDSMDHPEKAEIHNNLGWVYVHLDQYNRA